MEKRYFLRIAVITIFLCGFGMLSCGVVQAGDVGYAPQSKIPAVSSTSKIKKYRVFTARQLKPFFNHSLIVNPQESFRCVPIIGFPDGRITAGQGDAIYVKNLPSSPSNRYNIFRQDMPIIKPEFTPALKDFSVKQKEKQILGYLFAHVGKAKLLRSPQQSDNADHFSTLEVTHSKKEIMQQDCLQAVEDDHLPANIYPHRSTIPMRGQIISLLDGGTDVGKNQVVVFDLGKASGVAVGDLFSVLNKGEAIYNVAVQRDRYHQQIPMTLPNEKVGELLTLRTFDYLSLGFILDTQKPIRRADIVTNES